MLTHLLNGLGAIGNLVDLPGSSARDLLAGKNPFDQWLTPLHDTNRTSGRDLLRHHGLVSNHDTWANFAGGLAAEALSDPTNLLGTKAVLNAWRAHKAAKAANVGVRASNTKSLTQRAAGYLPEESVAHIHPSLKTATGQPRRVLHGTPEVFDKFDLAHDSAENLYSKGVYNTDTPVVANEYSQKWGSHHVDGKARQVLNQLSTAPDIVQNPAAVDGIRRASEYLGRTQYPALRHVKEQLKSAPPHVLNSVLTERPANIRMAYMDARKPFHADDLYPVEQIHEIARKVIPNADYSAAARNGMISGKDFAQNLAGPEAANEALRRSGFDAIIHRGGKETGDVAEHTALIAMDPSQMHLPYVAKRLQPELRVPSRLPSAAGLAGYNAAARGLRPLRTPRAQPNRPDLSYQPN